MKHRKILSLCCVVLESLGKANVASDHILIKNQIRSYSRPFNHSNSNNWLWKTNLNFNFNSSRIFLKMGCSTSKVEVSSSTKKDDNKDSEENDYVEGVVCQEGDLKENDMKQFDLDEGKVLLVKQNGKISALGTKCTHYGAPLVNGALGNGRIRCQWHGACFNLANGDIEDFPGLDSLPCYKVTIEGSNVKVRAKKSQLIANKRVKPMAKLSSSQTQKIVVIGGGPAGATCVEALRQEGYEGHILLICKEPYLPYDRVKVSKAMDFEIEKAQFRSKDFYKEHGIEVWLDCEATGVDTQAKTVKTSDGKEVTYDKLFIATGSKARKVNVPGAGLKNVIVLRDYDHAKYTNGQLSEDKEVVVLGSSFIAMEAANYCLNKVKKVTVIFRGELPFQPLLGPEIGRQFMELFKEKGVNFITHNTIKAIHGDGESDSNVKSVELTDGTILSADLVIMGVGSSFYTEFLQNSGIDLREDGSIEVNEYLQTNVSDVYAGGDIAYAPVWSHDNLKAAIGHYPLAHYHGKMAALNMLNKRKAMEAVPYFWTMLFGKGIRYCGHGKYDDVIITGNVADYKFVAFYLKNDEVIAVSSCGMDPIVSKFGELLAQNRKLYRNDLKEDPLAWTKN